MLAQRQLTTYLPQTSTDVMRSLGAEAAARATPHHHQVDPKLKYGKVDLNEAPPDPPYQDRSYADTNLASRRIDIQLHNAGKSDASEGGVDSIASQEVITLAKTLFEEADADDNGKIDAVELQALMVKLWAHMGMRLSEDGTLREPVDHHEKICNGGRWVLVEDDIRKMMNCFDVDHDGWVDFAEVCGILGTEPWAKVFPTAARPGLDAALARVLREWQTSRSDPVLVDRLHSAAAELTKLETEKQAMEIMIAKIVLRRCAAGRWISWSCLGTSWIVTHECMRPQWGLRNIRNRRLVYLWGHLRH